MLIANLLAFHVEQTHVYRREVQGETLAKVLTTLAQYVEADLRNDGEFTTATILINKVD